MYWNSNLHVVTEGTDYVPHYKMGCISEMGDGDN